MKKPQTALCAADSNEPKYICTTCDYETSHKSHWTKHIATRKHIRKQEGNVESAAPEEMECLCGRSYTNRSSLWKHKKRCKAVEEEQALRELATGNAGTLVKKLCEAMDIIKKQNEVISEMTPKVGNNNNNTFNFNLFLSEHCQNAMTIQHFMDQLKITLADLVQTKTDAITNIIISNLEPLAVIDRPLHAIKEGAEWYVNDEANGWAEEEGGNLVQAMEDTVHKKWPTEFADQHPAWIEEKTGAEEYVHIAKSLSVNLSTGEKDEVLSRVAKHVELNEDSAQKGMLE